MIEIQASWKRVLADWYDYKVGDHTIGRLTKTKRKGLPFSTELPLTSVRSSEAHATMDAAIMRIQLGADEWMAGLSKNIRIIHAEDDPTL